MLFSGQVGQAGLHWTVEGALERETPLHPAAAGGKLPPLHSIENATANVAGSADGLRGGSSLTYSSQSTLVGAGTVTDKLHFSTVQRGLKHDLQKYLLKKNPRSCNTEKPDGKRGEPRGRWANYCTTLMEICVTVAVKLPMLLLHSWPSMMPK
jgi:hypothetical protein